MDLVRGLTSFLTMWIIYHAAVVQEKGIETDQRPQVKIEMVVEKPKPSPRSLLNLNTH